jgi:hypothetical protein
VVGSELGFTLTKGAVEFPSRVFWHGRSLGSCPLCRQNELEGHAAIAIWSCPDAASMILEDRSNDGESHAHSRRLGGIQGSSRRAISGSMPLPESDTDT